MMKDRTESWLHLFLSAILPLLVGSGGTALLVHFKEHLPEPFFITVLIVIWLFFIVKLIELIFGDWLKRFRIWIKACQQHRARKKLVKEWRSKWKELSFLIAEVIESDWQPTEKQKRNYTELHSWFIKNRGQLLPLWHSFNRGRRRAAHEHERHGQFTLAHKVFVDNRQDPFSYFYEPLLIEELGDVLRSRRSSDISYIMVKLKELIDEFVEWSKTQSHLV